MPYSVIQQFLPCITDYRIKAARQHTVQHECGVPLPATKSPRMCVDESQLDHFLCFITSLHMVQDLPFGQRYLYLSNGKILETPNVIRAMIPQRVIDRVIPPVLLEDQLQAFQCLDNAVHLLLMHRHSEKGSSRTGLLCG